MTSNEGAGRVSAGTTPSSPTGRTRLSGVWAGLIIGVVVLVLLLVFILQNTESVRASYFSASWTMPLGVALLLAAVGGVLVAGIAASLRIWQLRHRLNNANQSESPMASQQSESAGDAGESVPPVN